MTGLEQHDDPNLDYCATLADSPHGTSGRILKRSHALPYEASYTTTEGTRTVSFDRLDDANRWLMERAAQWRDREGTRTRTQWAVKIATLIDTLPEPGFGTDRTLHAAYEDLIGVLDDLTKDDTDREWLSSGPDGITTRDGRTFDDWTSYARYATQTGMD